MPEITNFIADTPPPAVERFARLAEDVVLHVSPSYGLLKHAISGESVQVQRETKDILLACDGTRRVRDILDERLGVNSNAEARLLCAVVELVDLASRGLLILDTKARRFDPPLTGDPDIYYPLNLQVELTTACNLRCFYCYREAETYPKTERLATDELLDIL